MHHDRTDRRIGQAGVLLGILATSLPAAFADDARTEAAGIWFITRASSVELRSAGPDIAQYPVLRLGRGELIRLESSGSDGDWARVQLVGPAVADVRGLMPLGPSTLVEGDVAVVQESTPVFAPNLRSVDSDGRVSPHRSWRCLMRLAAGSKVFVTEEFEVDGRSWALIAPPDGVVLWVDPSKIRPATEEEIPANGSVLSVEDVVEQQRAARLAAAEAARLNQLAAAPLEAIADLADATDATDATETPGGELILARPMDPIPDDDDAVEAISGDWFIVTKDDTRIYSKPYSSSGSYTVHIVPRGVGVLVQDFEDGSARIAAIEGAGSVRGLLQLDDSIEVDGNVARILDRAELRAPNLSATEEGRPNPMRSYTTMLELLGGESLVIVDRFDAGGESWLQVETPAEAALYIRGGEIRAANAEEIELITRPPAPQAAESIETELEVEAQFEPEVDAEAGVDETGEPTLESDPVSASGEDVTLSAAPTNLEPAADHVDDTTRPARIERVLPPPPADALREISAEVMFDDGTPGVWKVVRSPRQGLRTDPFQPNSYTFLRVDEGTPVCVTEDAANNWRGVRLVGPVVEDVRGLLKADPARIEFDGITATILEGRHDLKAPNIAGTGLADEDGPDPIRSFLNLCELGPGSSVKVTGTLVDDRGDVWLLTVPPLEVTGWIHDGYLRNAPPESLPRRDGVDDFGRPRFVLEEADEEIALEVDTDDDTSTDVEPQAEIDDEPVVDNDDDTSTDAEPQAEVDDEPVVDNDDDTSTDAEPQAEVDDEPVVDTDDDTSTDAEPQAEVDDEPVVDTDDDTSTDAEPQAEIDDEPVVDTDDVEMPEVDLIDQDSAGSEAPRADSVGETEITIETPAVEPEPEPAPALSPELLAQVTLADAEAAYSEVRSSEQNDAELEALELIYRTIAERTSISSTDRNKAETRLRQIGIQRDLQRNIDALRRLENRTNADRERIEAIRRALLDRADYTAIGRMSRSRVYDGRTLPLLYRLEDPNSGRTIAYIRPSDALSIQSGVGRIVGIVGTERDDPGYRIRIITPERFEIDLTEEIDEN
jgi:hypothetical protein